MGSAFSRVILHAIEPAITNKLVDRGTYRNIFPFKE